MEQIDDSAESSPESIDCESLDRIHLDLISQNQETLNQPCYPLAQIVTITLVSCVPMADQRSKIDIQIVKERHVLQVVQSLSHFVMNKCDQHAWCPPLSP